MLSEADVAKLKADPKERDKIKVQLEEALRIGETRPVPVDVKLGRTRFCVQQQVATEDAIRNFCNGMGDGNPLYRNLDYARNSIYGSLVAPPMFIHAICTPEGAGLTYLLSEARPDYISAVLVLGHTTEWFKTIREGDRFSCLDVATEVRDLTRERTPVQFMLRGSRTYKNQRNEVVVISDFSCMVFLLPQQEETSPQRNPRVRFTSDAYRFSDEEVEHYAQLMEQEETQIRGKNPRYWEEINVGDQLPPIYRWYTTWQAIVFFTGACIQPWDWRIVNSWRPLPIAWLRDPETNIPDYGALMHFLDPFAQQVGMERAWCPGMIMECWMNCLITNWMSDAGFLKKLATRYRGAILPRGSLAMLKGEVVEKRTEGDEHLVDLKITLEDQRGVQAVPDGCATATVVLPSRRMDEALARRA
jgi:acyl dehydratase